MANKKRINNLSNLKVSNIFNIPYATVCAWSVKDKNVDWRPHLLTFLASLTEEEIDIVKNRVKGIKENAK